MPTTTESAFVPVGFTQHSIVKSLPASCRAATSAIERFVSGEAVLPKKYPEPPIVAVE